MILFSHIMGSGYYEHKLIKPNSIELRDYQTNLADDAKNENSLIVLPTGLGKTTIALQIMAHVLSQNIIKSYGLKAEPENIHLLSFTSAYYNKYGTLGFLLFPSGGNNGGINYNCIPMVYQNSSTSLISSLDVIYYISRIFIWFLLREYSNKLKPPQYSK